ncbi:MAG TPA: hypothetical protein VNJ07_07090 [Chitinophagales bacterium]|nr:hypothetical protein [Chitinophagales bacterium]
MDAVFHRSDFFKKFSILIRSRLNAAVLPSLRFRSYFLAHIFLELLLDRVLVKHNPQLCVKLYRDIELVNPEVTASYFSRIGKAGLFSEFFYNFNRFLRSRFLLFYIDNEMFAQALLRVYQKINPVDVSRNQVEILMTLTDEMEKEHRQKLLCIFGEMNKNTVLNI